LDWCIEGIAQRLGVTIEKDGLKFQYLPRCFDRSIANSSGIENAIALTVNHGDDAFATTDPNAFTDLGELQIYQRPGFICFRAFLPKDSASSEEIRQLVEDGTLSECSLSVDVKNSSFSKDASGVTLFQEAPLREISLCERGACPNTDCRVLTRRQLDAGYSVFGGERTKKMWDV
jgi:phage head maturation protease